MSTVVPDKVQEEKEPQSRRDSGGRNDSRSERLEGGTVGEERDVTHKTRGQVGLGRETRPLVGAEHRRTALSHVSGSVQNEDEALPRHVVPRPERLSQGVPFVEGTVESRDTRVSLRKDSSV